jgi:hypothetical protein
MKKYTIVYHKFIVPGHYLPAYKRVVVGIDEGAFAATLTDAVRKIEEKSGEVFFVFCGNPHEVI